MKALIPIFVTVLLLGFAFFGLGLVISPRWTLPKLATLRLTGWGYDSRKGSAIPLWMWRVVGMGWFIIGLLYGAAAARRLWSR